MNDFLKNLRANSKDGRFDRQPRKYNNPQYRQPEGSSRKYNRSQEADGNKAAFAFSEVIPELKMMLEAFSESQRRAAEVQQQRIALEEKKIKSLESLAASLMRLLAEGRPETSPPPAPEPPAPVVMPAFTPPPPVTISPATFRRRSSSRANREVVLNTIVSMRDSGATYNEIAEFLEENNVPTFSGKGKWHAQTIHRVCQAKV